VRSLAGQTKTQVGVAETVAGLVARRADAKDAGEHVIADTFLRFKGLERPFVVVTELSLAPKARDVVRMHIALTRATLECAVVATYEEIAADPRSLAGAESMPAT
jgi:hypothetical protein